MMDNLNNQFPGGYRRSNKHYQYYLIGDIFQAEKLPFNLSIYKQMEKASMSIGKFATLIEKIPNPHQYIRAYSHKEATQSSRIEGTQTNIEDAYKQEEDIAVEKRDDWQELHSYIVALNTGVAQLKKLPLCNRLIKQVHKILLSNTRGQHKRPGEFRTSQNWIGGSRPENAHFVPPSAEYIADAMSNLENFIQDESSPIPYLLKAGLIHYQFETIHPFLDGNGRIGRMLISLYLLEKKLLKHPILYLSNFFERNRKDYYFVLDEARKNPDGVVQWLSFFLDAIIDTGEQGIKKTQNILKLQENLTKKTLGLGVRAHNAKKLLDFLFQQPLIKVNNIVEQFKLSQQRSQSLVSEFVKLGILNEVTGYKRNRKFRFNQYLELLYEDD